MKSDPIYVVVKLLEYIHQSASLTLPSIISLLRLIQKPRFIGTEVLVYNGILLLSDLPSPFQANINSDDYLHSALTNI